MNNAWDLPFAAWNKDLQCEFVKWLVDTYGDKGAHQYFNEFRAVKDVMASVEPKYDTNPFEGYRAWKQVVWATEEPIYKQPTQIITSAGMLKMAQEILNNSMREVIEKHEHNLT